MIADRGDPMAGERSRCSTEASAELSIPAQFAPRCEAGNFALPLPGDGRTGDRFFRLRKLGHGDLSIARLGEGHADALAILAEANSPAPLQARLGVWAAGPNGDLRATQTGLGWRLDGVRRWCSGAFVLTHALATASTSDGDRLFLVSTETAGLVPDPSSWPAVGMAGSGTYDVTFEGVGLSTAAAIGEPGYYLARPGFWVGAIGVAAVWLGGAEAVASALARRTGDEPHTLAHLGAVHPRLHSLSTMLGQASEEVDRRLAECTEGNETAVEKLELLARSVRAEVEFGATEILERTARATGAGPLCHDAVHARRVADLTVYLRQSHAERDLAVLGALALRLGRADPTER